MKNDENDLFHQEVHPAGSGPLAARMRPRDFAEVAGQAHLLGPDGVLFRAVAGDTFRSILLYGPPGTGKTTIARICAEKCGNRFVPMNAVLSGVAELRAVVAEAESRRRLEGASTVVFIDEIHRYNRAQQDALLPSIEEGVIRFIGATTYNPSYYITAPLASRSLVLELKPLQPDEILARLRLALTDPRGFGGAYRADEALLSAVARAAGGDCRRALNLLEAVVQGARVRQVTLADLPAGLSMQPVRHDREGDDHYDVVSAFIKSMRGSDLDATAYWLARMFAGGEDPKFIARRIMIQAAEDVGLADPRALEVAVAAFHAAEAVGLPEAKIPLSMAALYVASAPKSNTACLAIAKASALVEEEGDVQEVPRHLTAAGKDDYRYPHDQATGWCPQDYLSRPLQIVDLKPIGYERRLIEHLEKLKGR